MPAPVDVPAAPAAFAAPLARASASAWPLILLASSVLLINTGIRQTVGLFLHPISHATDLTLVDMSLALAVGQLFYGILQPICGIIADKKGSFFILAGGALLIAVGQAGAAYADSAWLFMLTLGFLSPSGIAAGGFSMLIGATAGKLPAQNRSFASGIINAGGSAGQFLFAPMVHLFISFWGYASALWMLALWALSTIPLSRILCRLPSFAAAEHASTSSVPSAPGRSVLEEMRSALKNPSYLLLHAGFFTCGFHLAFLATHLPGEVALCGHPSAVSAISLSIIGLCNIAGSLFSGYLGTRYCMKYILAGIYGARSVMIGLFILAPKTETSFYIFAAAIGFTWLATVPPTAGIVGKLFGVRHLATLFGLTLLTHQVGSFLGAWLGGVIMTYYGTYLWLWYADMILALLAALVNLPIKETPPVPQIPPTRISPSVSEVN